MLRFCSNYFSENADIFDFVSEPPLNTQHKYHSAIKNPAWKFWAGFQFCNSVYGVLYNGESLRTVSQQLLTVVALAKRYRRGRGVEPVPFRIFG
jgi:hypothetical protein